MSMSATRFPVDWTRQDDAFLVSMAERGLRIRTIAVAMNRSEGSVQARMRRLGLDERPKPRPVSGHFEASAPGQPDLDEQHWRACLTAGGFVWREIIDGRVVEFRPGRI